jgi:uncharacterized protein YmfQ (DUF2313 family)
MDNITVRTPYELLYQQRKKVKLLAHGIAEVLSKARQFMACRFLKDMLESWLTGLRKDAKTLTSRSLEVMEKTNYNMHSTLGSVGTSAT